MPAQSNECELAKAREEMFSPRRLRSLKLLSLLARKRALALACRTNVCGRASMRAQSNALAHSLASALQVRVCL